MSVSDGWGLSQLKHNGFIDFWRLWIKIVFFHPSNHFLLLSLLLSRATEPELYPPNTRQKTLDLTSWNHKRLATWLGTFTPMTYDFTWSLFTWKVQKLKKCSNVIWKVWLHESTLFSNIQQIPMVWFSIRSYIQMLLLLLNWWWGGSSLQLKPLGVSQCAAVQLTTQTKLL